MNISIFIVLIIFMMSLELVHSVPPRLVQTLRDAYACRVGQIVRDRSGLWIIIDEQRQMRRLNPLETEIYHRIHNRPATSEVDYLIPDVSYLKDDKILRKGDFGMWHKIGFAERNGEMDFVEGVQWNALGHMIATNGDVLLRLKHKRNSNLLYEPYAKYEVDRWIVEPLLAEKIVIPAIHLVTPD